MDIKEHIAKIKVEIALIKIDGHIDSIQLESKLGAVEYELEELLKEVGDGSQPPPDADD